MPRARAFQQAVWRTLLDIPAGRTSTYAAVAARAGSARAVRAAGAAIGRNPLSIIVPCHRVLGRDGSLTGYAGGLQRKQALLRLEGALPGTSARVTPHLADARTTSSAPASALRSAEWCRPCWLRQWSSCGRCASSSRSRHFPSAIADP